jgi:hypothetical protein
MALTRVCTGRGDALNFRGWSVGKKRMGQKVMIITVEEEEKKWGGEEGKSWGGGRAGFYMEPGCSDVPYRYLRVSAQPVRFRSSAARYLQYVLYKYRRR